MTRINRRRVASIAAIVHYIAAFSVGLVLVVMVFLAGFGWYLGEPRGFMMPGQFAALAARSMALVLVMLFLLPGHVSAWLEPVADERRVESLGAER